MPDESRSRVLGRCEKKSTISACTLEQCGLENLKNTKNTFLVRGKISKSERLYNGIMLKVTPIKGYKESR